VAETTDGNLPRGENWHLVLLEQMMTEVPKVRPAVINLDPAKVEKLVSSAPELFAQIKAELRAFARFLEQ
jgi:hypothetical protein